VIALNRLSIALSVNVVLGLLAWTTLDDSRIRGVTLAVLAFLAGKILLHRKDVMHAGEKE
jgi:hypothetical protein